MIDRLEAIAHRYREKRHKGGRPPLWGTPQGRRAAVSTLFSGGCPAEPGNAGNAGKTK